MRADGSNQVDLTDEDSDNAFDLDPAWQPRSRVRCRDSTTRLTAIAKNRSSVVDHRWGVVNQ
jgi:hypothetical protein